VIRGPQWEVFFEGLGDGYSIKTAARRAGIGERTVYDHRDGDPAFRERMEEALEVSTQKLEEHAYKRAIDGSDLLAIFMLKARRPDVYDDRRRVVEHVGKGGAALNVQLDMGADARAALASLLRSRPASSGAIEGRARELEPASDADGE